jgi:hypothetical protein
MEYWSIGYSDFHHSITPILQFSIASIANKTFPYRLTGPVSSSDNSNACLALNRFGTKLF